MKLDKKIIIINNLAKLRDEGCNSLIIDNVKLIITSY